MDHNFMTSLHEIIPVSPTFVVVMDIIILYSQKKIFGIQGAVDCLMQEAVPWVLPNCSTNKLK